MDRVKWIETKGKRILYSDYSGLKTSEELFAVVEEGLKMAKMSQGTYLAMHNFTNATVSNEFTEKIHEIGKELEGKIEKRAVIGMTGLKAILFQGFLRVTGNKMTKA
ncbi:MAG: hypothetical protein EHM12_04715, partial [Dehalococcoidia bacterium]